MIHSKLETQYSKANLREIKYDIPAMKIILSLFNKQFFLGPKEGKKQIESTEKAWPSKIFARIPALGLAQACNNLRDIFTTSWPISMQ